MNSRQSEIDPFCKLIAKMVTYQNSISQAILQLDNSSVKKLVQKSIHDIRDFISSRREFDDYAQIFNNKKTWKSRISDIIFQIGRLKNIFKTSGPYRKYLQFIKKGIIKLSQRLSSANQQMSSQITSIKRLQQYLRQIIQCRLLTQRYIERFLSFQIKQEFQGIQMAFNLINKYNEIILFQPYREKKSKFNSLKNSKAIQQCIDYAIIQEKQIQIVSFGDFIFDINLIKQIGTRFKFLRSLIICSCNIGNEGVRLIENEHWVESIQFMGLKDNLIDSQGAKILSKISFKKLSGLCLNNNLIKNKGFASLAKGEWPQLRRLEVRRCQITIDGFRAISQAGWHSLNELICDNMRLYNLVIFRKNFAPSKFYDMIKYVNWGRMGFCEYESYLVLPIKQINS